jgi:hypothetical protein
MEENSAYTPTHASVWKKRGIAVKHFLLGVSERTDCFCAQPADILIPLFSLNSQLQDKHHQPRTH